ncbi:MAG: MBL fold metallo-hydrolase [Verrucomicrobiota bacterium]
MNIHTLDLLFQSTSHCIASYLLESDGELALVETGPASTLPALTAALTAKGFRPSDVSKVLLTHIHLDHGGAAWWWAQLGVPIYVHERGARHLVDPAKLRAGARAVYGANLESLWGALLPCPHDLVHPLQDGDTISLGSTTITAWDTPGHAFHHHSFVAEGIAFTGDVAGVRLPGETYISPTTAPSQFAPAPYDASLKRLLEAKLDRLFLTHFGEVAHPEEHLSRYRDLVKEVASLLEGAPEEAESKLLAHHRERANQDHLSEAQWDRYELANPTDMCAQGILHHWARQRERAEAPK